jgi:hypothetical protein
MERLLAHPSRNLVRVAVFMLIVWAAATFGYVEAGWNFQDALYLVTLTVFAVAPSRSTKVEAGDGVVVVGRSGQEISALFAAPKERVRAGRTTF